MSSIGSSTGVQSQILQQIGMKVLGKVQQAAKSQGEAAVSLLAEAAELQKAMAGTSSTGAGGSGSSPLHGFGAVGNVLDVTA